MADDLVLANINAVNYVLEVDQFTENVLEVPVRLTNVPKGFKATIMPSNIDVYCKVALRDIKQLQASDIEVICDFSQLAEFPKREHLLLKINKPSGFFEILNTSTKS